MTRKLPWLKEASTTTPRPKKSSTIARTVKRSRVEEPSSSNGEGPSPSAKNVKGKGKGRDPSTSPPPEPPVEVFMEQGLEHDDKYRIVEDEFLGIAKRFTVHLHAAEYKRQEKLVKARNAEAINSISRPVTGKMPDNTRRKVESIARSKAQRSALEGLVGKHADRIDELDDNVEGLPYVGTTLHGLMMDSPRKKAISLAKFGGVVATTRAAAGYQRPSARTNKTKESKSPQAKIILQGGRRSEERQESSTESSDGDDDLDAPISAPKFTSLRESRMNALDAKPILSQPKVGPSRSAPRGARSTSMALEGNFPSIASPKSPERPPTSLEAPIFKSRVERRLEHARQQKAREESDQRKKLDIIPNFF
ncbi:hypothetical protein B7494_g80 [Chlorociboria aeruginascens]|nr:hypothetical protein B7494_g80 [Chlorociboria aeruginascens]